MSPKDIEIGSCYTLTGNSFFLYKHYRDGSHIDRLNSNDEFMVLELCEWKNKFTHENTWYVKIFGIGNEKVGWVTVCHRDPWANYSYLEYWKKLC